MKIVQLIKAVAEQKACLYDKINKSHLKEGVVFLFELWKLRENEK